MNRKGTRPVWTFDSKHRRLILHKSISDKPFVVRLDRCQTSAGALRWIMEVAEQDWATDRVIASLVHEFDRLLYPLANLCPAGKEDGPINVKKVIREQLDLVK
ncbi:MAG: hypothetical protein CV089_00555 [Nitrospira sp. WS110]|nr:hypothetical protein [Nitrospira sp. WS110]